MIKIKKILVYLLIFVIVLFVIPAIYTKKAVKVSAETVDESVEINNEEKEKKQEEQEKQDKIYDYNKYANIKIYHKSNSEIEELPIDEYLYGVVSAEMPANYEVEALKAQAIVSRTYTLYQMMNGGNKHGEANMCDDSKCCQEWISKEERMKRWNEDEREKNWEKIVNAINSTSGRVITFNKLPIDAFFHSNSGGVTEIVSNVWGGKDFPYLKSVETAGEDNYSQYSSEVKLSKDELLTKLKKEYSDIEINFSENNCIEILDYTESKRVKSVKFGNKILAGTEVRSMLGLKSTNFKISIDGDNISFFVIGYGHGVGMSQTGADSMAKNGSNCDEIIKHFYSDVEIMYVNDL